MRPAESKSPGDWPNSKGRCDIIYLASPFSHCQETVRESRFQAVRRVAADMMGRGIKVYSPICYTYQFFHLFDGFDMRWEYWKAFDLRMLGFCERLVVLQLIGWESSIGVRAEIEHANLLGIPVEYVDHYEPGKDCPDCRGSGTDIKIDMGPKFPNAGRRCNRCSGTGKIMEER